MSVKLQSGSEIEMLVATGYPSKPRHIPEAFGAFPDFPRCDVLVNLNVVKHTSVAIELNNTCSTELCMVKVCGSRYHFQKFAIPRTVAEVFDYRGGHGQLVWGSRVAKQDSRARLYASV